MRQPGPAMDDPIFTDQLPRVLRELIECVGEAGAFRLVEHRGGAWICVPVVVTPDHMLASILTPTEFARLVEWYASETVMLPKYDSVARQIRYRTVVRMRQEGAQIDEIVAKTGYSSRWVWKILAESDLMHPEGRPQNLNLF